MNNLVQQGFTNTKMLFGREKIAQKVFTKRGGGQGYTKEEIENIVLKEMEMARTYSKRLVFQVCVLTSLDGWPSS
jgi:hypothetical protein